jgi:hypothetical protein
VELAQRHAKQIQTRIAFVPQATLSALRRLTEVAALASGRIAQ